MRGGCTDGLMEWTISERPITILLDFLVVVFEKFSFCFRISLLSFFLLRAISCMILVLNAKKTEQDQRARAPAACHS